MIVCGQYYIKSFTKNIKYLLGSNNNQKLLPTIVYN